MPPRVLLTGKNGQLGRAVVAAALERGCHIVAMGRGDLDVTDRDAVARAVESVAPDIVVNAAAYTDVDGADRDPRLAEAVNRDGVAWLAESACRHDATMIHISTDFVFDGGEGAPYAETYSTGPINEYGRSKLAGETALVETGARHLIVRTSWLFSEHTGNFVSRIAALLRERDTLSVVDDQIGTPTDARFLAEVIMRVASDFDRFAAVGHILHVSNSGQASRFELASHVLTCIRQSGGRLKATGIRPVSTSEFPTTARRPRDSRLSIDRLRALLGAEPPDWHDAVTATVARLEQVSRP